jgi:hypothetical protein
VAIEWTDVLKEGAKAFGSAVGGPIGNALADAILGKGAPAQDLQKIEAQLTIIESKIDALAKHVIEVLPRVIYDQSLFANLSIEKAHFTALRTETLGFLESFHQDQALHADSLAKSINNLLTKAELLISYGPPFYSFGVSAMSTATAVFVQLLRYSITYSPQLEKRAAKFDDIISPWLDPSREGSFNRELSFLSDAKNRADAVLSKYPNGVPHCLLLVSGAVPSLPPPSPGTPVSGLDLPYVAGRTYYIDCVVGYLDRTNPDGSWSGGNPFPTMGYVDGNPADINAAVAQSIRAGNSKQIPVLLDWCLPLVKSPQGWHMGDYLNMLAGRYNEARAKSTSLPPRIKLGESTLAEINGLRNVCRRYCERPLQ